MKNCAEARSARCGRTLLLVSLVALTAVGQASARECKGVSFPDQATVEGKALELNGLGIRQATAFKVNVYVGALYVASPTGDAQAILKSSAPKQLILQFLRKVSAGDLAEAWDEGFKNNAEAQLPVLKERIEQLKGWMADMKTGDRLTFTFPPGKGLSVEVNGAAKGTIAGDDFSSAFLSLWLGPKPPNPNLKTGLLGGACE